MERVVTEGYQTGASDAGTVPSPPLSRAALAQIGGIALTPLILAALGMTHPTSLNGDTASWWHHLHLILIPLFPLLGVNLWWLLAGFAGPLPWLARIAAFIFIGFYGALDLLAGVAVGLIRDRATREGRPELLAVEPWLFSAGNALAEVGVWAFLLGCLIASGLLLARVGRPALPGAVLLCIAAVLFLRSHIYFPVGVATTLLLAVGFGLLQWARLRQPPPAAPPQR